jgi:hypothetical protein
MAVGRLAVGRLAKAGRLAKKRIARKGKGWVARAQKNSWYQSALLARSLNATFLAKRKRSRNNRITPGLQKMTTGIRSTVLEKVH